MDLQKACEIADEMLKKDAYGNHQKLSMEQFAAINQILLELQADKKYVVDFNKEI